jgi:hypothetical protein
VGKDEKGKINGFPLLGFSGPREFFDAALVASSVSLPALMIFILMWTGSVSIHLFGVHERSCRFCQSPMDTRHYFGCSFDTCQYLNLIVMARSRHFSELVRFTLNAYFSFLWRSKPLVLTEEEALLVNIIDEPTKFLGFVE